MTVTTKKKPATKKKPTAKKPATKKPPPRHKATIFSDTGVDPVRLPKGLTEKLFPPPMDGMSQILLVLPRNVIDRVEKITQRRWRMDAGQFLVNMVQEIVRQLFEEEAQSPSGPSVFDPPKASDAKEDLN